MNKIFFKDKSILITGGTGSFGKALASYLISNKYPLKKIVIFSRDELKQFEMREAFPASKYPMMRFFIGDVRDKERLRLALNDVDFVIHAAALKQVPAAEYNPIEFIKTNILGAQNIIELTIDSSLKSVIALSTDKASSPINLYGATKLCSDKLFISANNIKGKNKIKYIVVRYGNVMGSRGSVLERFIKDKNSGTLNITDPSMTRFNISLLESVKMVLFTIENSFGGEIFVPKLKSYYLKDLAKAVSESCKINIIGSRPGEKTHEEMISFYDSRTTMDLKDFFVILPEGLLNKYLFKKYLDLGYKLVNEGFVYRSDINKEFLSVSELKNIIKEFIKK
jgi:UDP-N-acetylglucosamine 4,6-dehydratase (inverting)